MRKKSSSIFILLSVISLIIVIVINIFQQNSFYNVFHAIGNKPVIVIDAGHGGDPGKVGVTGALEKDINLSIAFKLRDYLVANDCTVILTREDDNGLYSSSSRNKKIDDLKRRCEIINSSNADLVISIHQNSFPDENVNGAQVFYYDKSQLGKTLAQNIQESLRTSLDSENTRQIKGNTDYYIFLHSKPPTVIVECGFLSNFQEEAALLTEDYQSKAAFAIALGVMNYINSQ